ncbi:MAG: tetratricopeptide repeat protein [Phycisphaerales bacterium JB038]
MRTALLTCALTAAAVTTAAAPAAEPLAAEQAYDLRLAGASEEAKVVLEQALQADAGDALGWYELARTEFYLMQFDEAAAAIERAIALEPAEARYHHFAGVTAGYNAVLQSKDPATHSRIFTEMAKSLQSFAAAVEIDPEFHEARVQLINMLVKTPAEQGGDLELAKEHAATLQELDPVFGAQAEQMLAADEPDAHKVKRWTEVAKAHPKRAQAHVGLAEACLATDNFELAESEIAAAVALDPQQGPAYFGLVRSRVMNRDRAAAQAAAQQYLDTVPEIPTPLRAYATFLLAALERQAGNAEASETMLAKAKKLDPHVWTTFMEPPAVLFEKL